MQKKKACEILILEKIPILASVFCYNLENAKKLLVLSNAICKSRMCKSLRPKAIQKKNVVKKSVCL